MLNKAQIILDAAKVSAASGESNEQSLETRSQSAGAFAPSTMRVPQPDIIEHFGNTRCPCRSCQSSAKP